jgi:hypothetical protein
MKCCALCIGDQYLAQDEQRPFYKSSKTGRCDYCGTEGQKLVDPPELFDAFSPLLSLYIESTNGTPLLPLIRRDWPIFSNGKLSDEQAIELLSKILDIQNLSEKTFIVEEKQDKDALLDWERLKEELVSRNRFFLSSSFEKGEKRLSDLLTKFEIASLKPNKIATTFYRARITEGHACFPLSEMGAPPAGKSTQGRANPTGISYLYLASDIQTAISEIRPQPGDFACGAAFKIDACTLIDLRQPKIDSSPFNVSDEDDLSFMYSNLRLLEQLGEELSHPVRPQEAHLDYIPSQYLCEYIKSCGYDGVIYKSSISKGYNVALFDPCIAVGISVEEYHISKIDVSIQKISPIEPT